MIKRFSIEKSPTDIYVPLNSEIMTVDYWKGEFTVWINESKSNEKSVVRFYRYPTGYNGEILGRYVGSIRLYRYFEIYHVFCERII